MKEKSELLKPSINDISKEFKLFDGNDLLFKDLISKSSNYFEYGCGDSTKYVYVHSRADVYSVDTSQEWVNKTKNSLTIKENSLFIKWIDIGPLLDWGWPKNFNKSYNFINFTDWFWKLNIACDLVLIDARFRVCCFFTSIKYAKIGTKIIFDDYIDREHYHIVEETCNIIEKHGRQVLFEVTEKAKNIISDELIERFRKDPR